MYAGARITDAVNYFSNRGEHKIAIRTVRQREPERLRWRQAVGTMSASASRLAGLDRMRIEEPIREIALDLPDAGLRREVVLDARRVGLDLDRGEILPRWSTGDLRRMAHLAGVDLTTIQKWLPLSLDFSAPVDTAAVVVIGRTLAEHHRKRAQKLWLQIPDADGPEPLMRHHHFMAERAQRDADISRRWGALAKALSDGSA